MLNFSSYGLETNRGVRELLTDLGHFIDNEESEDAIRSYQYYCGLPQTGVWTKAEVKSLKSRTCTCPDISKSRTGKGHWDEDTLYLWLVVRGAPAGFFELMLEGARWWTSVCNLAFLPTANSRNASIYATYQRIDGRNGTLAWSMLPQANLKQGERILQQRYDSADMRGRARILEVAAHEMGHAIGIDHVPVGAGKALMNPFIQGITEPLGPDIAEAVERYGPVKVEPPTDPPVNTPVDPPVNPPVDPPGEPCNEDPECGEKVAEFESGDFRFSTFKRPI